MIQVLLVKLVITVYKNAHPGKPKRWNPALLFDTSSEDFPALAKKLEKGDSKQVIGDNVAKIKIKRTREGKLLVEINSDEAALGVVKVELTKVAGETAKVSELQQLAKLEIRDLDSWLSNDEIFFAIIEDTGRGITRVLHIRETYGTRSALILMQLGAAHALVGKGRVLVGLASCRVRWGNSSLGCARCLARGHFTPQCQGPDRNKCCHWCGEEGHFVSECTATIEKAKEFYGVFRDSAPVGSVGLRAVSQGVKGTDAATL